METCKHPAVNSGSCYYCGIKVGAERQSEEDLRKKIERILDVVQEALDDLGPAVRAIGRAEAEALDKLHRLLG